MALTSPSPLGSNLVKQALEGEFPKLLRLLNDLWVRLNQMTPAQTDLNMALLDNELVSAPSLRWDILT